MPSLHDLYGAAYDFAPTIEPPRKAYVMATTPRSGSTYFASRLWQAGDLGAPLEYLNPIHVEQMMRRLEAPTYPAYWLALQRVRTSPNGVFGHKLFMPYYLEAGRADPSLLPMLRSDLAVHLYRRDKVAQAVSLARAQQTQAWASWNTEAAAPAYNPGLISRCLKNILIQERWWSSAFELTGAKILSVAYEDFVGHEDQVIDDIRRQLGLTLDVNCPPVELEELSRQRDTLSADWAERFKAELAERGAAPPWERASRPS